MTDMNLRSSIIEKGRYVSQILHFINGEKRTFNNVDTHSIKQGQFTKFSTKDGRLVMVNDKNILCIEIITEDAPSAREVAEHERTHAKYRSWCKHCVFGRGKNNPHKKGDAEGNGVPTDYMYMTDEYKKGERPPTIEG